MNVITITFNPALDVTIWIRGIDFDEPVKPKKEIIYPGSKGVNVSRVLTALGVEVAALGLAGEKDYALFRSLLEKEGVHPNFITYEGSIRENLTICTGDSKVLKINRSGGPVPEMAIAALKALISAFAKKDEQNLLVFAGSIPPNFGKNDYKSFIMELGRKKHIQIALDSDLFSYQDLVEIAPYIIKPNLVELAAMFGKQKISVPEIFDYIRIFENTVEHVLVSAGSEGLVYMHKGKFWTLSVPKVEVKSTIGAGDTTLAGFIKCLNEHVYGPDAAKYAAACGCASVMLEGTDCISKAMVPSIMEKVSVKPYPAY